MNNIYEEALDNLRNRKPLPKPAGLGTAEKEQLARDYYANVRTNVLLTWVLSNVCIWSAVLHEILLMLGWTSGYPACRYLGRW